MNIYDKLKWKIRKIKEKKYLSMIINDIEENNQRIIEEIYERLINDYNNNNYSLDDGGITYSFLIKKAYEKFIKYGYYDDSICFCMIDGNILYFSVEKVISYLARDGLKVSLTEGDFEITKVNVFASYELLGQITGYTKMLK